VKRSSLSLLSEKLIPTDAVVRLVFNISKKLIFDGAAGAAREKLATTVRSLPTVKLYAAEVLMTVPLSVQLVKRYPAAGAAVNVNDVPAGYAPPELGAGLCCILPPTDGEAVALMM
jgi:hypothetical protein